MSFVEIACLNSFRYLTSVLIYIIIIVNIGPLLQITTMYSSSNSEDEINCTPEEIVEAAKDISMNLLPQKSKEVYLKEYNSFLDWQKKKNIQSCSERVLLAYFGERTKTNKASTLWSSYSKLKATLIMNMNLDIGKYSKLIAFLKQQSVGYRPKKSKILSKQDIYKFLLEAPDDPYLMMKVKMFKAFSNNQCT